MLKTHWRNRKLVTNRRCCLDPNKQSDEETLREAGYEPGNKYDKADAASDTSTSISNVSEAWHQARDDAASIGEIEERGVKGEPSANAGNEPDETSDLYKRLTGR